MEGLYICLVSVFVLKSYLVSLKSDQSRGSLVSLGFEEHRCFPLMEPGFLIAWLVRETRCCILSSPPLGIFQVFNISRAGR